MEYNTSELCDIYQDMVDVLEPMLCSFGGRIYLSAASSPRSNASESNGLIRELVKENGAGRVLLIDGGGSMRRALIDAVNRHHGGGERVGRDRLLRLRARGRHSGRLGYRHSGAGCHSGGADSKDIGETDLPVNFGGVTFLPDDHLYADTTGVILSPMPSTSSKRTWTEDGALKPIFMTGLQSAGSEKNKKEGR